jgi:hypothetical protein
VLIHRLRSPAPRNIRPKPPIHPISRFTAPQSSISYALIPPNPRPLEASQSPYRIQSTPDTHTMSDQKIPLEPPPAYEDRHSPDNVSASRHISEKTAAPASGAEPKRANPPRGPFPLDIPVLNQLRGKRVILASASPRRKQLLAQVRHVGFFLSLFQLSCREVHE